MSCLQRVEPNIILSLENLNHMECTATNEKNLILSEKISQLNEKVFRILDSLARGENINDGLVHRCNDLREEYFTNKFAIDALSKKPDQQKSWVDFQNQCLGSIDQMISLINIISETQEKQKQVNAQKTEELSDAQECASESDETLLDSLTGDAMSQDGLSEDGDLTDVGLELVGSHVTQQGQLGDPDDLLDSIQLKVLVLVSKEIEFSHPEIFNKCKLEIACEIEQIEKLLSSPGLNENDLTMIEIKNSFDDFKKAFLKAKETHNQ